MSTPTTSLDERYSSPTAIATTWPATQDELASAELFWLSTVRADGRPHVTPLVAVWALDQLHFTTGDTEQKAANLRANPHVILTTGCNDWRTGIDVVVEGIAQRATDQSVLDTVAKAFLPKWDGDWAYTTEDGKFLHPGGFQVELYSVTPTKVFAFAKDPFGHTVHRFGES